MSSQSGNGGRDGPPDFDYLIRRQRFPSGLNRSSALYADMRAGETRF